MSDFISDDDLQSFEGWLKYQAVPETITPEDRQQWREMFEYSQRLAASIPKMGRMKLPLRDGEKRYGVALRDGSDLWLTMWVKCDRRGDIYVFYPRADHSNPHASYHRDGSFHYKSYGMKNPFVRKLQLLTTAFRGSEHLGGYGGHGKSTGAICDPADFDGLVIVEPVIVGPKHGSVVVDVVEPGYQPKPDPEIVQRETFTRGKQPSVIITIGRHDQVIPYLRWPDDFECSTSSSGAGWH